MRGGGGGCKHCSDDQQAPSVHYVVKRYIGICLSITCLPPFSLTADSAAQPVTLGQQPGPPDNVMLASSGSAQLVVAFCHDAALTTTCARCGLAAATNGRDVQKKRAIWVVDLVIEMNAAAEAC